MYSVADGYDHFYNYVLGSEEKVDKIDTFQFVKWNYVIIDVPIYKYVAIDMLQVFVPLVLIAFFSLFIFGI